jgi:hypothetical protein
VEYAVLIAAFTLLVLAAVLYYYPFSYALGESGGEYEPGPYGYLAIILLLISLLLFAVLFYLKREDKSEEDYPPILIPGPGTIST